MMKVQQSTTCPVCLEGPDIDNDDYAENWNDWHQHLLELEEQTAPWLAWQKREPIATHKTDTNDIVHWLCRECVYRHDPVTRQFAIQACPVCRGVITIPGRDVATLPNREEYAHLNISDEESDEHEISEVEDEDDEDIKVYISGYQTNTLLPLECMLTKEVSIRNAARSAGQDITNASVLMVFTRNASYTPCGDERRNWGVQFLLHSIEMLKDFNCMLGGVQTCTSDQSAQPRRFQTSHNKSVV